MSRPSSKQKRAVRLACMLTSLRDNPTHKMIGIVFLTLLFVLFAIAMYGGPEALFNELLGNILVGIVIAELLVMIFHAVCNVVLHYCEDELKLTTDYGSLVEGYKKGISLSKGYVDLPPLYCYENDTANLERMMAQKKSDYISSFKGDAKERSSIEFPVVVEIWHKRGMRIQIDDHENRIYEPPVYLQTHADAIMAAHSSSFLYNSRVIRVDDWHEHDQTVTLITSRSTYYSSMITNRAVDYHFNGGPTIRYIYEYDGCVPSLKESLLSNHLGFNVILLSDEDIVVFVRRNGEVSVGKKSYGTSVAACLKARYALSDRMGKLTPEGVLKAITKEISIETGIASAEISKAHFSLEQNVICFFRDLVEGGKPQLLLYIKVPVKFAEIEGRFENAVRKRDENLGFGPDGDELLGVRQDDLRKAVIVPDGMAVRTLEDKVRFLYMVPSAAASVAMYLDWEKAEKTQLQI